MLQILLSNLAIILLAYFSMNYLFMNSSKIPLRIINLLNIVWYSTLIICLFHNPIMSGDLRFDLRVVVLLFLSITHGWKLSLPVLMITGIWRLTIIGGPYGVESVVYNMAIPVLLALFFYKGEKYTLTYWKAFLLVTGIWFVTLLPIIWFAPDGIDIFKKLAIVHYLIFTISFFVLYGLHISRLKNIKMSEKIHYMAYHDSLTGIPNRYKMNDYIDQSLQRCKKNNKQLAILFLDLDRFKFINDSKGHSNGDHILTQVAQRLVNIVREYGIVARQSGDEFLLLLEDIKPEMVSDIAQQITESFKEPFIINNEEFYTTASIGISLYPQDGEDPDTLIINADKAMYLAKSRGKNNFQFSINEQKEITVRKTKIEQGLRKAIINNELVLHFQPKVELQTGKIFGTESLIRWNHPQLGFIPPIDFISIAEQTGMIVPIGNWVLFEACKINKMWHSKGIRINIAVNVSALQFEEINFVDNVNEVLNTTDFPPEYLILEITESVMQNIDQSSSIIRELKKIGVQVSIDDFGTGYSSLSVLNNLPIDYVKIDKSFINEILTKENTASLIKMIIQMGHNFQFDLIAEGIETKQQLEFLRKNHCHYGQGYYFSKPLPEKEIEPYLEKNFLSDTPFLR